MALLAVAGARTIWGMAQTDAAHAARRDQGDVTRAAILRELARRERQHLPPPTWGELGAVAGVAGKVARYHCIRLRNAGLVTFEDGRVRTLVLTDSGRQ